MKGALIFVLILSSWVLCETRPSLAQAKFKSGIAGRVTDPRGAVIVDARIWIVSRTTKKGVLVKTNDIGEYTADLDPDVYDLEAEAPGFKKAKRKRIPVENEGRSLVDFMLGVKEQFACELRVNDRR